MDAAVDDEWEQYLNGDECEFEEVAHDMTGNEPPKCSDIYISTKTKIAYLSQAIDLANVFWKIPIMNYFQQSEGAVKKEMKINSTEVSDYNDVQERLKKENYIEQHVITHIDNPDGRIKFKDVRKVSIGIAKKDILSYRRAKKGAFYNCFVVILRVLDDNIYKEMHVKVFNTGKLEIPGIKTDEMLIKILDLLIKTINPYIETDITYDLNNAETVLINSNFNCGYYINRERLFSTLKSKYNIHAVYDPCSYPGIQCKFYYNIDKDKQNGILEHSQDVNLPNIKKISFMIFRTGSVMIVGKCDDNMLINIYTYLKDILENEFNDVKELTHTAVDEQTLPKKTRKKIITIKRSLS